MRFCTYELEELDRLVQDYWLPRSSLVNIAINEFLHSPRAEDFLKCRKHKVNLSMKRSRLDKLTQYAKAYEVHRTDLIRLAIRNFKQKYTIQDKNPET